MLVKSQSQFYVGSVPAFDLPVHFLTQTPNQAGNEWKLHVSTPDLNTHPSLQISEVLLEQPVLFKL